MLLVLGAVLALAGGVASALNVLPSRLGAVGPAAASGLLGLLAFPLQAPLILLILRGSRVTAMAPRDNAAIGRWVLVGLVVMLAATALQDRVSGPSSWVVVGAAAGMVLDAIRRGGRIARRHLIDVDAARSRSAEPSLRDPRTTILAGDPLNSHSCPLLPPLLPRVFISYTRSSRDASRFATALHDDLERSGARPFLDRASIPVGASWRRALDDHLAECDAFVCILDARGVQREWVAAEVLTAVEARRLTGTPEILLLVDPSLRPASDPMLPVFQGVLAAAELPPARGRPQILELNEHTRAAVSWGLRPGRFESLSVFTRATALPIMAIMMVAGVIGGLGLPAGFVLGLLSLLQHGAGLPFGAWFAERHLQLPAALVIAFLLGFTARAAIAWACEWRHERGPGTAAPFIASAGLAMAAFDLCSGLAPLSLAWAIVLAGIGWTIVAAVAAGRGSRS
ncbi:MAG: toll/interleukin-1 receptor domain-containing protein [Planctomycetes bacterium]|nr:toll/interleukin-1 receptor domain-containing protein [Planctomycetota bacterium]